MFGLFIVTSIVFEVRMRRSPTTEAFDERINWMSRVRTLYAVSALILIRSIFRVVEYAAGDDGYPLTHEWMLYVFDSVLMIISMLVWGIWHPGTTPRITVYRHVSCHVTHYIYRSLDYLSIILSYSGLFGLVCNSPVQGQVMTCLLQSITLAHGYLTCLQVFSE
ncbi:hypothetical protein ACN42_g1357 [Penicillium freii]|uniref:Uncharacterized protein n=1 Tax=Penicillium freii TaxID=48697 RepID=A0A101MS35_PENFR|nr:hypothetical protein ACN42_g1357 [Penicillium freii]